jgi:hypothetical protein
MITFTRTARSVSPSDVRDLCRTNKSPGLIMLGHSLSVVYGITPRSLPVPVDLHGLRTIDRGQGDSATWKERVIYTLSRNRRGPKRKASETLAFGYLYTTVHQRRSRPISWQLSLPQAQAVIETLCLSQDRASGMLMFLNDLVVRCGRTI